MKKWILILAILAMGVTNAVSAQTGDVVIARKNAAEPTAVPMIVNESATVPTPVVTLKDRKLPLSVDMEGAREVFPNGEDVPKPDLDRPIVDAWNDRMSMPYACQAILNSPKYFQQMQFGERFDLDVTFINTGTEPWDMNIDLMQYTGDLLEAPDGKYIYDIDKDYKANAEDPAHNRRIIYPGESIRITVPMRAPLSPYHDDEKYYSAYTLVKNWHLANYSDPYYTPWDAIHSGLWGEAHMIEDYYGSPLWHDMLRTDSVGMFCPVYFYIYVPDVDNYFKD